MEMREQTEHLHKIMDEFERQKARDAQEEDVAVEFTPEFLDAIDMFDATGVPVGVPVTSRYFSGERMFEPLDAVANQATDQERYVGPIKMDPHDEEWEEVDQQEQPSSQEPSYTLVEAVD